MKKIALLLLIQSLSFVSIPLFGMEKDAEQWLILGAGEETDIPEWNKYFADIKEKEGRTIEWVGLNLICPESPKCIQADFNDLEQLNKALADYDNYYDVILFDMATANWAKWTPAFLQIFKQKLKEGGKFYIPISLNLKGKEGYIKFADPSKGITLLKSYFGPNVGYYEDRGYPSYHWIYKDRPDKEKYYLIIKSSVPVEMPGEIQEIEEEKEPFPYNPKGKFAIDIAGNLQNISLIDKNKNLFVINGIDGGLPVRDFVKIVQELMNDPKIKLWWPVRKGVWFTDTFRADLSLAEMQFVSGDSLGINIEIKSPRPSLNEQYPEIYKNLKKIRVKKENQKKVNQIIKNYEATLRRR